MATISPAAALRLGFRFNPSPEKVISYYLRCRVLSEEVDTAGIVHEAQVYSCEPKDLAAAFPRLPKTDDRFFFSTCKRRKAGKNRMDRTAGDGSWVTQKKESVKNEAKEKIGSRETLLYTYKKGGAKPKSHWLMEEYRCYPAEVKENNEEPVFCKIYVSPRAPQDCTTRQESAAGDILQVPAVRPASAACNFGQVPAVTSASAAGDLRQVPEVSPASAAPHLPSVPSPTSRQGPSPSQRKKRPATPITEAPPVAKKSRDKPASAPHHPSAPCPALGEVPLPMLQGLQAASGLTRAECLVLPVLNSPVVHAPSLSPEAAATATAEEVGDNREFIELLEKTLFDEDEDQEDP